ncbi:MAG: pentapeptide repeat-containing protein [Planctomycetota bacterium]|nr:pentapeptide repeat-containing protein [Planctomycetota bacterium]
MTNDRHDEPLSPEEAVALLKKSVAEWNGYRKKHPGWRPALYPNGSSAELAEADLRQADLRGARLRGADLQRAHLQDADLNEAYLALANLAGADLTGAKLPEADLSEADLDSANLTKARVPSAKMSRARLVRACLREADLRDADLCGADLTQADLRGVDLRGAALSAATLADADLSGARLAHANFSGADLTAANLSRSFLRGVLMWKTMLAGVDFSNAVLDDLTFSGVDLSGTKGLETVRHAGPSNLCLDTLWKSRKRIPLKFLIGTGVPARIAQPLLSLVEGMKPSELLSCAIIHARDAGQFATKLCETMRGQGLRVWRAPQRETPGWSAVTSVAEGPHDKLILVLSEQVMSSGRTGPPAEEVEEKEHESGSRCLFPVRLVESDAVERFIEQPPVPAGRRPDATENLKKILRRYALYDFSNWRDEACFDETCRDLIRDLCADGGVPFD